MPETQDIAHPMPSHSPNPRGLKILPLTHCTPEIKSQNPANSMIPVNHGGGGVGDHMPNFPNRCQHIKVNGTQCGSPALRRNKFCYFHKRHQEERLQLNLDRLKQDRARRRNVTIELPVLEDANSIQVSLMQVMRLIITGQIDSKTAGLLLYGLQIASSNLARTNFNPYMRDVVLDPKTADETPLNAHAWEDSDFASDGEEDEDDDIVNDADEQAEPAPAAAAAPLPARRPPASTNFDEIRKRVRDQVIQALPEIAAAQQHRENGSGKLNGNGVG